MKMLIIDKNSRQVPRSEPQSIKKKEQQDTPQITEITPNSKKGSRIPSKRCPGAVLNKMSEETQVGHTSMPSNITNNQTSTGTYRAKRRGAETETSQEIKQSQDSLTPSREACQRLAQCLVPRIRTISKSSNTCKIAYCITWWQNTIKGYIQRPSSDNWKTLTYQVSNKQHPQEPEPGLPQK